MQHLSPCLFSTFKGEHANMIKHVNVQTRKNQKNRSTSPPWLENSCNHARHTPNAQHLAKPTCTLSTKRKNMQEHARTWKNYNNKYHQFTTSADSTVKGSVTSVSGIASLATLGNSSPNNSCNHPRHTPNAQHLAKQTCTLNTKRTNMQEHARTWKNMKEHKTT